jgi:hypothetical protein
VGCKGSWLSRRGWPRQLPRARRAREGAAAHAPHGRAPHRRAPHRRHPHRRPHAHHGAAHHRREAPEGGTRARGRHGPPGRKESGSGSSHQGSKTSRRPPPKPPCPALGQGPPTPPSAPISAPGTHGRGGPIMPIMPMPIMPGPAGGGQEIRRHRHHTALRSGRSISPPGAGCSRRTRAGAGGLRPFRARPALAGAARAAAPCRCA